MLAVFRFEVAAADEAAFRAEAAAALDALAARPGLLAARLGRGLELPSQWLLILEWSGVGDYRRAMSAYDVRVRATPLLARVRAEPTAYELVEG